MIDAAISTPETLEIWAVVVFTPEFPAGADSQFLQDLQRIEHETAIAQLGRRKSINPTVLDPAKLGQFSDAIRSRLRSADPAFRRQWLRLFVAEVCIGPQQIRITGPNDAICDLIEHHDKMGAMVPNFDREWRARRDSNS